MLQGVPTRVTGANRDLEFSKTRENEREMERMKRGKEGKIKESKKTT